MIINIKVPATSANIGPGFDIAGMALNLYNTFSFDFNQVGVTFSDQKYTFATSLTLDTMFKVLDIYTIKHPKGVHLTTTTNIPVARGLGSSSTCIVAGVLAANAYGDLNLSKYEIAKLASIMEGHPDNVVPALFGNLNLSLLDQELYVKTEAVHSDYGLIALIPHHEVSTQEARTILPKTLSLSDLTHTQSRSVFLLDAFKDYNPALINTVIQDIIHEPYRKQLIKDIASIEAALKTQDILAYWVSGAGPTLMVLCHKKDCASIKTNLESKLKDLVAVSVLQVDTKGAIIV